MSRSSDSGSGRRRTTRRLFFCLLLPLLGAAPSLTMGQGAPSGLPGPTRSIDERQMRISHGPTGDYRVVEVLTVGPSAAGAAPGPLALVRPGPRVFDVMGLGGDVEASQVIYVAPDVSLTSPIPQGAFKVGLAYHIPADAPRIEVTAALPTDRLLVLIDRGGLTVEVDATLEANGMEGSPARPIDRYVTRSVEAGAAIVIGLPDRRVGWRQRLAALAAACLAAGTAALLVWRRDRAGRSSGPS